MPIWSCGSLPMAAPGVLLHHGPPQPELPAVPQGWQLCHNASGEMTGQFPTRAENLLDSADFSACIRDDTLDAGRTEIILRELRRAAGTSRSCLPQSARRCMITVESFVGRGGE